MTSADAAHRRSGAVARGWRNFRRWRRGRPFWAGLFTLISALLIFGSTQLTLSGFQLKIGVEGFLTYLIPLVLALCGLLIWLTPQQRVFYGVIAAAVALYSLIGVNLGGFFLGMLFGVIGGSLAVAWTPVTPTPPAEEAEEPGGGPAPAEAADADEYAQPEARVDDLLTGPLTDTLPPPVNPLTEPARPAQPAPGAHRYDDDPGAGAPDLDDTQHIPVQREDEPVQREDIPVQREDIPVQREDIPVQREDEEQPPEDRGNGTGPLPRRTPRLFAITLIPLLLTAFAIAGVHGGTQARAQPTPPYPSPCPTNTKSASAAKAKSQSSSPASRSPASEPAEVTKPPSTGPSPAASRSASASPSPSSTDDGGGLISGVIDGIGDLLGIGEDATPAPSATPSATPASPAASSSDPAQSPTPEATLSSAKPTKSASATPKPTSSADCVVVDAKQLNADGLPVVQKVPDRMQGSTLTLHGFAFDGVTELNTADGGTIRVLQFSMSSAVTDNFKLTVPGDHTTVLKSSALTVRQADGDGGQRVKFYCSEFFGKLAGLIPLSFTPDSPPSLTLPEMVFTGIDIQLVFVDTDELLAPDLNTSVGT